MKLVQAGATVNAVTTRFAQTPAHIAAFGGHQECLRWLIKACANVNEQDYVGETPIHKAARSGSLDCIHVLVSHGAEINLKNGSGQTAADLAHAQGFQECAQFLLNAQNHQLNGLFINGALNGIHQNTLFVNQVNRVASRKRTLRDVGCNGIKKARTDAQSFEDLMLKMNGGTEDDLENMHIETESPVISGGIGQFPANFNSIQTVEDDTVPESGSLRPKEIEIFRAPAMQTPCRCTNIFSQYF